MVDEKSGPPADSFAALFEQQAPVPRARNPRIGDRLEARVVQVGRDAVFVELDGKRQAYIDAVELRGPDGTIDIKVGDMLAAHVVEVDPASGQVRLGRSMGKPGSIAAIEQAKEAQVAVEGKVTGVNKGGLEVDLSGTRAFCPMKQVDKKFVEDPKEFIGKTLRFLVTEIRDGGKSVVLSRRAILDREASESASRTMRDLAVGAVVRGTVTGVREFGAFVDLGGVEGMIPASEVSHDRSRSVGDALKAGDVVDVLVREIKEGVPGKQGPTTKITLSLKALAADPWAELDLAEGRVVVGTIVRVVEFGAFVRLAAGVEGLLHVSELAGKKDNALRALGLGESMNVVVKSLDRAAKKIGLVPAPEGATVGGSVSVKEASLAIGSIVKGKVDRIETYGVFVQVDGTRGRAGRGLVPSAELGVPRGTDLRKTFPEGTPVVAKVLETGEGRLRLSLKAAKDDEERAQFEEVRGKGAAPKTLGTFADLLNKKKK
jgi:small subunit ribosomal protein S1